MSEILQVHTTLPSAEQSHRLAQQLVEARLAACVQVLGPMQSVYRWEGRIETTQEWLVIAKTTTAGYAALEAGIQAAHPYQTPEILAVPASAGLSAYLNWVAQETT